MTFVAYNHTLCSPSNVFFDYGIFNLVQCFLTVFCMWPIFKTHGGTWLNYIFFSNFTGDLKKVIIVNFRDVVPRKYINKLSGIFFQLHSM